METRVGRWLPEDHRILKDWLQDTIQAVDAKGPDKLYPSVEDLWTAIDSDARLYMLFNSMFAELPTKKPYRDDPAGHHQIRDARHMCQIMNHLLSTAPQWTHRAHVSGTVGLPFNAMFDWPMGTPSGWALFLDPAVNKHLKAILNDWGSYLQSSGSANVLGDDTKGWLGIEGKKELTRVANDPYSTNYKFEGMFVCQPEQKYHGFKSWDDFFTHVYRERFDLLQNLTMTTC